MKLVIGIVRPEKANDVLEALYRAEVRGVSISRIQGHGGELDRVETYRGTTVKMGLSDKVRFEVAVSDSFVDPTVEALCESARTGEVGDGKIFVVPLERAEEVLAADRLDQVGRRPSRRRALVDDRHDDHGDVARRGLRLRCFSAASRRCPAAGCRAGPRRAACVVRRPVRTGRRAPW